MAAVYFMTNFQLYRFQLSRAKSRRLFHKNLWKGLDDERREVSLRATLWPKPTKSATGASTPTLLRSSSHTPENFIPKILWESIWNRRFTPSIPRPSIFVYRYSPGPNSGVEKPPSNSTR